MSQLKNLSLQEGRFRRQREKDTAGRREMQNKRNDERKKRLDTAGNNYIIAVIGELPSSKKPMTSSN